MIPTRLRCKIAPYVLLSAHMLICRLRWGESAGAASVGYQLTAYNGRNDGLFRAGIMESGNPVNYNSYRDLETYQPLYENVTKLTGCNNSTDTLNCLRSVPFDTLNELFNTTTASDWQPIVDGDFIQQWGSVQLEKGNFVKGMQRSRGRFASTLRCYVILNESADLLPPQFPSSMERTLTKASPSALRVLTLPSSSVISSRTTSPRPTSRRSSVKAYLKHTPTRQTTSSHQSPRCQPTHPSRLARARCTAAPMHTLATPHSSPTVAARSRRGLDGVCRLTAIASTPSRQACRGTQAWRTSKK